MNINIKILLKYFTYYGIRTEKEKEKEKDYITEKIYEAYDNHILNATDVIGLY